MILLRGFALLLLLQILGETVARLGALPVPGPVLGMLLLLVVLVWKPSVERRVGEAADALLVHLSLLFVPAGVGVVAHLARLEGATVAIASTLAISTLVVSHSDIVGYR